MDIRISGIMNMLLLHLLKCVFVVTVKVMKLHVRELEGKHLLPVYAHLFNHQQLKSSNSSQLPQLHIIDMPCRETNVIGLNSHSCEYYVSIIIQCNTLYSSLTGRLHTQKTNMTVGR